MLRLDGSGNVVLNVTPREYQAILCALEAGILSEYLPKDVKEDVRDTWERLLVDGGHVGVKELQRLRKLGG